MKVFKKISALVIAMVMVLAMALPAMADPANTTITIPSTDSHTYQVYQIFTGELVGDVLSNIHWGKNGTHTEGALVDETTLKTIEAIDGTDAEKAAALSAYADLTKDPAYTVSKAAALTVPTGYYLLKDATAPSDGDEATLYILQVVGPTTISRKAGTTESDKKLDDKNDSDPTVAADNGTLQTSSDYDIGDEVPYHVTATISEKVGQYPKYHITLEDILESGKFDSITLDITTITLGGDAVADTDDYTVTTTWNAEPTKDGFKVTYEFTPKEGKTLESLANKTIAIDFTAKLGEGAAIGSEGNKNTLKVKYSNNPNDTDSEGEIPDKVVITFTYKVLVDKFDDEQKPLAGAGFTLYKIPASTAAPTGSDATDAKTKNAYYAGKAIQTWTSTAAAGTDEDVLNRFSFDGIDDGTYVLAETTTPAGYNTIDPQVFTVKATHDGVELTSLTGEKVSGTIEFTESEDHGTLSTGVINNQGSTLPSTGGIGTTIFYVIGGILVLAAAIVLIARRKAQR